MVTQFTDSFEAVVLHQEALAKKRQQQKTMHPNTPAGKGNTGAGDYRVVEYSSKAVAVFGDTRAIKDELRAMGGKFNARLTFKGEKMAGWIFSKAQEQRLACYFGLD